jgi:hypothetical protein
MRTIVNIIQGRMWIFRVVYYQRTSQSVAVLYWRQANISFGIANFGNMVYLCCHMRMVPERTGLRTSISKCGCDYSQGSTYLILNIEVIFVQIVRYDGALCNHCCAVVVVRA